MRFLLIALFVVAAAGAVAHAADDRRITVTGQGRSGAAPDMATISLGIVTEHTEAAAALRDNAARVTGLFDILTQAGIAGRDRQTGDLNLYPRHAQGAPGDDRPPGIIGFTASSVVTIRVRDLDRLGRVLDQVLETGVNRLHGLQFGFAEPVAQQDAARVIAVADARRKAVLYAEAAGVRLGRVLSIAEAGAAGARPVMMEARSLSRAVADMPVAGGEVTTRAAVTIVYELTGGE